MSWAVAGIRHTSAGRGHPYRIDPDQRHPVQLVGGDPFELRVLTDPTVAAVTVELDDGAAVPMQRVTLDDLYGDAGGASGDGHLAAASGSRPDVGCAQPWRVRLTAPPHGVVGYRFAAAGCSTERFVAPVGVWSAAGGELSLVGDEGHGDGRVVATDWLVTDDGVVRARIALALAAGERVVGFGERFDSFDQRGRVLDTTVFEQYKQQGNRTYLPSPFAIVAGGERGWGFHVRTSRRVHFDVGHAADDRLLIELAVDPARPVVELRLYEGDPRPVLAAHLAEVGGLRRPPDWVFRPWMSANDWNTQARRGSRGGAQRRAGGAGGRRRDRGLERRVDVHGVPRRPLRRAPRRRAARRRRRDVPARRRLARSGRHDQTARPSATSACCCGRSRSCRAATTRVTAATADSSPPTPPR